MKEKPILFEAACIFSIVGSSIGFVIMFTACFFFDAVTEKVTLLTNITATEKLSPVYFAIFMAAYSVSLTGAIKIYRRQRAGLFFYLAAQLVMMCLPVIWLGSYAFSVTNTIFTGLFITVYLSYYRILNKGRQLET